MRYGINLQLWTDAIDASLFPLLEDLRSRQFDHVELSVSDFANLSFAEELGKKLDELGFSRTICATCTSDANPASTEATVRVAGVDAVRRALDFAATVGATALVGPVHSAVGYFTGKGPTDDEWRCAVESAKKVGEHAAASNLFVGYECLNRFECYLLNTTASMIKFLDEVAHPHCRMTYNTFHAHIEERDVAQAIRSAAKHLLHVHLSENDRSAPGAGAVRWQETFDALHKIRYNDAMVIEAYGMAKPQIVEAARVWRRLYSTELILATEGLQFIRNEVEKRWTKTQQKVKREM